LATVFFLDKDVVNLVLLQGKPYFSEYYNTYVKNQTYQVLLDLAKLNTQENNRVVILDGYFGDKLNKEPFVSFLKSNDFEVKIIYFECPFQINKQRLVTRGEGRDKAKLEAFESFYLDNTSLHYKELSTLPHLSIHTEMDIDDNVEKIINDLSCN
jgi:predicted kinase